ncbi:MAG: hypothetical protein AAF467_03175 [Actinomycetota bacterium]
MSDHRPLPPLADGSPRPAPATHRHDVKIDVYVKMSSPGEAELEGAIGSAPIRAESGRKGSAIVVTGAAEGHECNIRVRLNRFKKGHDVSGEVHGQPVSGTLTITRNTAVFEGMAGAEHLHYQLDPRGRCSNFGRDLGVHVDYQPLYCEIVGGVDRVPDGVMIALLVPAVLAQRTEE